MIFRYFSNTVGSTSDLKRKVEEEVEGHQDKKARTDAVPQGTLENNNAPTTDVVKTGTLSSSFIPLLIASPSHMEGALKWQGQATHQTSLCHWTERHVRHPSP